MFVWKKRAAAALAIALAAILLCSFGLAGISAASLPPDAFTVVLDAGHGGVDPGVVGGTSGAKESDINLLIVKELANVFSDAGFRVVLTRANEGGLYGLPTAGYKRRDMQKRKEIIENARPDVVISVHQNNFLNDRSRRGGQAFFRPGDAAGQALADCIQAQLNGLSGRELSALAGDYFMLNCTAYPSVIVECGFLSNAEDEKLLLTQEYRCAVALSVFKGVLAYFA